MIEYDFEFIGIDTSKYQEVLSALAKLQVDPRSIKPAISAREDAFGTYAGTNITVTTGVDLDSVRQIVDGRAAARDILEIAECADADEAFIIGNDVKRYFERHFPGRYVSSPAPIEERRGTKVFAIFMSRD